MNSNGQLISFPVDALLDQSVNTSTATALPGTCAVLKNLEKTAEAGALTKRHGYRAVNDTSWSQSNCVRVFGFGDQLVSIDADSVCTYTAGSDRIRERDRAPKFQLLARRHIAGDGVVAAKFGGCAISGDYRCWVWQQRNWTSGVDEIWSVTLDNSTGAPVRGPERLSTAGTRATLPRVLAVQGAVDARFYVHWMELGTSTIKVSYLAATDAAMQTGSWSASATAASSVAPEASEAPSYDVTLTGTTGAVKYALAYVYRALGVTGIRVYKFFSDGVADTPVYEVGIASVQAVTICGEVDAANVWVASAVSTTVTLRALDSSYALLASATVLAGAASSWTPLALGMQSSTRVCLIGSNPDNEDVARWNIYTYAAGSISAVGANHLLERVRVESKPFFSGGEWYAWCHTYATPITIGLRDREYLPNAASVLVKLTTDGTVAATAPGQAQPQLVCAYGRTFWGQYEPSNAGYDPSGAAFFSARFAPQAVATSDSNYYWGASVRPAAGTGTYDTAAIDEYAARPTADAVAPAFVAEQCGRTVICSGGCQPMQWDGQQFVELGHTEVPVFISSTPSGSGGSILAGTYQYAATYENTDATGQRHQSNPQIQTSTVTTTGSSSSVSVLIATSHLHSKADLENPGGALSIVLWRTKDGPDGTYRRVAAVQNDLSARYVTIVDTLSDTELGNGEPLYTSQSELEHVIPPPSRHVVPYQGRVAGIDAEFPTRVWFSKKQKFDEGFSYSPALEQLISGIGELEALAESGGTLYAFSQNGIAVAAYGDGVDNTAGGTWPAPQIVCRGIGCIDARAITTCPDGVVFASGADGRTRIWLLPQGSQVPIEIGTKVRTELDTYTAVTSMCHAAAHARVYITIANGAETSEILVYDYGNKGPDGQGTWLVWSCPIQVRSAAFVDGAHWLADPDATALLKQSTTSYADLADYGGAESFIAYDWQTHDFRVGAFAPFGKLNKATISYEYAAAATVYVSFSTSQGASWSTPFQSVVTGLSAGALLVRQMEPDLKRFYSGVGFRVRLQDASPDGGTTKDTASVLPRGLTIDYIALQGTLRPASTERMTQ